MSDENTPEDPEQEPASGSRIAVLPDVPTLLVVDDNDSIRRLLKKILDRIEYQSEEARDGVEAIEKLEKRSYDGIMLDLMMPRADGFAVIDYLKRKQPEALARTIILTADSSRWNDSQLAVVGAVVRKPFTIESLIPVVQRCCASRRTA